MPDTAGNIQRSVESRAVLAALGGPTRCSPGGFNVVTDGCFLVNIKRSKQKFLIASQMQTGANRYTDLEL